MSHEIRTPLTAILGFTDILLNDGDIQKAPPRRIEHINTIKRNGEHLLGILNDILDLSKIEAEKLQIESIVCEPVVVVKDVLDLMKIRADSKSIKLDVKWDSLIPAKFNSDPMRLKQILVNLIGNAIKFTELGGVTLNVNYMNNYLEFSVVDTGIGMSPEQTQRIFEAFGQADASMSRKFGGTGLGLIISKRLASLMHGDVELVYSTIGKGTCFKLYIQVGEFPESELIKPQFTTKAIEETNKMKEESKKQTNQLEGLKILYAEDGVDNQSLVSFMLKKQGAEIEVVENGQLAVEAYEQAKLTDRPYDIILMDMQMPVLDGYQATSLLREKGETIPIIALTAHAMGGEREKCIAAGCTEYTTKPIKKEELFKMIVNLTRIHPETPVGALVNS
jgi:CheY-like chemotaxis protein